MHPHPFFRKRAGLYPARGFWVWLLDRLVVMTGVLGLIVTLPQLSNIFIDHNAAGVSALSWGAYAILDIPWILYGLIHREKPIVFTYVMWLFVNTIVAVGALVYR